MTERRKVPASAWQRLIEATPEDGVQPLTNAKSIATDQIHTDARQPRKHFDERAMRDLVESVRERGILQPITVQRDPAGGYFVVTGERRLRAAREVELKRVPVLVVDLTETELRLDRVIENRQRKGLTDTEFAAALREIKDDLGARAPNLSSNELDEFVGKHVGIAGRTVRSFVALLNVAPEVREMLGDMLTELRMRGLSRLSHNPELQIELAKAVLEQNLSGRQTVAAASLLKRNPSWTIKQALAAVRGQANDGALADDRAEIDQEAIEQQQNRYWNLSTNLSRAVQTLTGLTSNERKVSLTAEQVVDLYRLLQPLADLMSQLKPAYQYLEDQSGEGVNNVNLPELPGELRIVFAGDELMRNDGELVSS